MKLTRLLCVGAALFTITVHAETDPGIRGGAAGAGQPLGGLTQAQFNFFAVGATAFNQTFSVPQGLGPRFNALGCGGCHAAPALGGSAPAVNPQVAAASQNGAQNIVPPFITQAGPVREVRFVNNPDGSRDGGVHQLFTIRGRTDAPAGCNIAQEDFATEFANNNLAFRIPTPVFGAGLIEGITEQAILANKVASANVNLGINGKENRNPNDGTITRFGWKAQNKSLLLFAGEASNVEQGVTNPLFPQERAVGAADQNCIITASPDQPVNFGSTTAQDALGATSSMTVWMQLLAPPTPSTTVPGGSTSIQAGRNLFQSIGCANCHTPTFITARSPVAALSQRPVNLFSDLLLHKMGANLADNVSQGLATGDEWRTAPLWGLGQRRFFLHDGRTTNLVTAIQAHFSLAANGFPASEANAVINSYNALSDTNKQNIINFLRSL
jgi:CxxC motif-containing protein (DUF1111 family)